MIDDGNDPSDDGYGYGRNEGYRTAMSARGRSMGVGRGSGMYQTASDHLLAMVKGGGDVSFGPNDFPSLGDARGHTPSYREFPAEDFPALTSQGSSRGGSAGGISSRRNFATTSYEQQFPSLGGVSTTRGPGGSGSTAQQGQGGAAGGGAAVAPHHPSHLHMQHPSAHHSGHAPAPHHHTTHHQATPGHMTTHQGHRSTQVMPNMGHPHYPSHMHMHPTASMGPHPGQLPPHMSHPTQMPASPSPSILHQQQQQQQQAGGVSAPTAPGQRPTTPTATGAATTGTTGSDRFEPYLLTGLLPVVRMTNPDLNTLALGTDLTTLGLNLSSPDNLSETFASPFLDAPIRRGEPEYHLPLCYYVQMQPVMSKMSHFREDTLFYIFYTLPQDVLQIAAARALYNHNWRFHIELQRWLIRGSEPQAKTATYERGTYIFFEPTLWERQTKTNFVLQYEHLEEMPPELPVKTQ